MKGALSKILIIIALTFSYAEQGLCDELRRDSVANKDWWQLLKHGDLSLQDTTVQYPRFLEFCLKTYNWADKTFNTYDPEYVAGTGHKWKVRLVNDNWSDSYLMRYRGHDLNIRMLSNLNVNLGAYLHFMALSVGYSIDMNTIFGRRTKGISRFETNFNCALFNADIFYNRNSGGTFIRRFSGVNEDKLIKVYFPGVDMKTFGISLYYFFNHGKYSQGAAYNFSKIQKKSSGSWLAGLSYNNLDIDMNFGKLDQELLPHYTYGKSHLVFHYFNFNALFGYGYNWVWHPQWLFNATIMPSVGVNKCYENSTDGNTAQFALNIHGRTSVTYNHRAFFASIIGKFSGNWYTSKTISLFNAIEYFSANIGVRF